MYTEGTVSIKQTELKDWYFVFVLAWFWKKKKEKNLKEKYVDKFEYFKKIFWKMSAKNTIFFTCSLLRGLAMNSKQKVSWQWKIAGL